MIGTAYDPRPCALGEGALWHPERQQLFWFDILGRRLLTRDGTGPRAWDMGEHASAAGWIDRDSLLVATETALARFDLETGARTDLLALEADRPANRSNDGRADPWGGFWIGTMGKRAESGAGAIYRFHGGRLVRLFGGLTIPNAISFAPDRSHARFADTARGRVLRVALDADGWPLGEPEVFRDFSAEGRFPDGAVFDAEGLWWVAIWGAGRVLALDPEGVERRSVTLPAPHSSCPAFGGAALSTLFCTTALDGMGAAARAAYPLAGQTFACENVAQGLAEPPVILSRPAGRCDDEV